MRRANCRTPVRAAPRRWQHSARTARLASRLAGGPGSQRGGKSSRGGGGRKARGDGSTPHALESPCGQWSHRMGDSARDGEAPAARRRQIRPGAAFRVREGRPRLLKLYSGLAGWVSGHGGREIELEALIERGLLLARVPLYDDSDLAARVRRCGVAVADEERAVAREGHPEADDVRRRGDLPPDRQ